MIKHFQAVAESVNIDITLYSIPDRSVISIEADTANTLKSSLKNIAGIGVLQSLKSSIREWLKLNGINLPVLNAPVTGSSRPAAIIPDSL